MVTGVLCGTTFSPGSVFSVPQNGLLGIGQSTLGQALEQRYGVGGQFVSSGTPQNVSNMMYDHQRMMMMQEISAMEQVTQSPPPVVLVPSHRTFLKQLQAEIDSWLGPKLHYT